MRSWLHHERIKRYESSAEPGEIRRVLLYLERSKTRAFRYTLERSYLIYALLVVYRAYEPPEGLKGGRSIQLRTIAFESEQSRHFPYMDLFSSGA